MWRDRSLNGRVLTATLILTIFVTMSSMALGLPSQARLMPLMVGVPGSILGLIQVFQELRTQSGKRPKADRKTSAKRRSELQMFGWTFLFLVGVLAFGFLYAAPTLVFGFLCIAKKESRKVALAAGMVTWVLLRLFERGFELQLFAGLLVEWLRG